MYGVGHFDHPGTTLQVLGAATIRINYLLNGEHSDIYIDVLSDPEGYLKAIYLVLMMIDCLTLFFSGLLIYRWFNNIFLSLLFQLIPFASTTISYQFSSLTSENLLIPFIIFLITYSFGYSYNNNSNQKKSYLIIFSLLAGLGLATKITFFPVFLIPLILLKGLRNKLIYVFLSLISFLIFFLPAISNIGYFTEWVKKLFMNDGLYGGGQPRVVDLSSFTVHLKDIFANELFFTFSYSVSILIFLLVIFKKQKNNELISNEFKLLVAFIAAMTVQIIIVSKHYSQHYMIPALILCIPSLIVCVSIVFKLFNYKVSVINSNYAYLAIIFSVIIFAITVTVADIPDLQIQRDEALKVNNFINDNYSNAIVISSYGSSSRNYALAFSALWAGSQKSRYLEFINRESPDKLYFSYWKKKLYSSDSDTGNIRKILHSGKKIIFQNSYIDANEDLKKELNSVYGYKNAELVEVLKNANNESVYEVKKEN